MSTNFFRNMLDRFDKPKDKFSADSMTDITPEQRAWVAKHAGGNADTAYGDGRPVLSHNIHATIKSNTYYVKVVFANYTGQLAAHVARVSKGDSDISLPRKFIALNSESDVADFVKHVKNKF